MAYKSRFRPLEAYTPDGINLGMNLGKAAGAGVAAGAAALTGLLLGIFWVKIEFPALLGWDLDLHFPYLFALIAGVSTLVIGVIASFLPAWRAAHLQAADAIRHE